MQCGPIRSLIDLDPHTAHLHSGYDMPGELGMLHDWHLCEGHFPDFFQDLKHLLLPGEIGRYRYPIFPAPLTYRQPAVPAGLHTSAPFHQPVLLIGFLYTRRLLHPGTSLSQSLEYSLVLPCIISDSYSLPEAFFPDKSLVDLTLTAKQRKTVYKTVFLRKLVRVGRLERPVS